MEISRTGNTPFQTQTYQQQTTAGTPGNTFQELVSAQIARPSCDTFTLSSETPAVDTESAAAELATDSALAAARTEIAAPVENSVTILPTDSTEVKLAKLREIADASDYTGMSYEDIYTEIWNRYNDAFDGNIEAIRSAAVNYTVTWANISNQFTKEVDRFVFNPLVKELTAKGVLDGSKDGEQERINRISDIRSAPLGYAGMSYEEKEAAIIQKYQAKNTFLDFLNMQGELKDTMVYRNQLGREGEEAFFSQMRFETTNKYLASRYEKENILTQAQRNSHYISPEAMLSEDQWNYILSGRFELNTFFSGMRESLKNAAFSSPYIEKIISSEINHLVNMMN